MKVDRIGNSIPVKQIKSDHQRRPDLTNHGVKTKNSGEYIESGDVFLDKNKIEESVELLNKTMEDYKTELQFTLHEASGEYMVKIINTSNNEVIKELPAERVLNMVAYFKELLGIVVDKFI